jgi:hypothetical protein
MVKITPRNYESFKDDYEDVQPEWQQRAARLQARRWRKLKHQLV